MALSLVSIFDSTNDLGTAVDECLLVADEQIRGDLNTILGDVKELLKQEKESLNQPPPDDLIEAEVYLIGRLNFIGNNAEELQTQAEESLETWRETIDDIREKEEKQANYELLFSSLSNLTQGLAYYEALGKGGPSRIEATFHLLEIYKKVPTGTKFSRWLRNVSLSAVHKLKDELENELSSSMKSLKWPVAPQDYNSTDVSSIARSLSLLTRLLVAKPREQDESFLLIADELVSDMWGIRALARPSIVRFQYHFSTERSTNRVDRPEWFIAFIIQTVRETAPLIESKLQPALHNVGIGGEKVFVDLLSQFVRVLVRTVHNRLETIFPAIAQDDALICHTMDELLAGDRVLMGEFGYGSANIHWPTMSSFFFNEESKTSKWLKADLKFAKARMNEILASPTSWQSISTALHVTDESAVMADEEKEFATECSESVMSMIDALGSRIDLCKTDDDRESSIRVQFVEEVQCELIKEFVNIASKREGLAEKINTLFAVSETLLDWRLKPKYASIKQSVKRRGGLLLFRSGGHFVKRFSTAGSEDAKRSSAAEDEDESSHSEEGEEDRWVFTPLVNHTKGLLENHLNDEIRRAADAFKSAMKDYERKFWSHSAGDGVGPEVTECSPELRVPLSLLRSILVEWRTKINSISRIQLVFGLASRVQTMFESCILRGTFSDQTVSQLRVDVEALGSVFDNVSVRSSKKLFSNLFFAVRILQLPLEDVKKVMDTEDLTSVQLEASDSLTMDVRDIARCRLGID